MTNTAAIDRLLYGAYHQRVPTEIDIFRTANVLVREHGADAPIHAAMKADEMLGPRLLSLHNLHFYGALMREAREMIRLGKLRGWVEETIDRMREQDEVGGLDD